MATKNVRWVKIADRKSELQWQSNNLLVIEVENKKLTLARTEKGLFACAYKCPHASGVLADGFIDATGNIVCPLHRYKFSLANGRNVSGEGYYVKVYVIDEREEGIFIGFESNSWMQMLT